MGGCRYMPSALKIPVLWCAVLCQLASSSHHFKASQCLHLQGQVVLQNVRSTEPTTQCHIPWILSPRKLSSENIKSCKPKGPALYVVAVTSVDGLDQSRVSSVAGRTSGHLWTCSTCQKTMIRYAVSAGLLTACLCGLMPCVTIIIITWSPEIHTILQLGTSQDWDIYVAFMTCCTSSHLCDVLMVPWNVCMRCGQIWIIICS